MKGTKVSTARRSLLMSVVSLLLCAAMLIGTTFAWFTDTVSNTGNRIQAGNLKIDLLMDKGGEAEYVSIANGTGDIFKEAEKAQDSNETLWEPGKTQFVKLAVENKGNLAVKYTAYIDVTDEGLVGSLEYALLSAKTPVPTTGYTDWASVKADIVTAGGATGTVPAGRTTIATGILDEIIKGTQNERDYVLLAVHMKEHAGNEYQDKDAIIGVTIVATQKDAESDAFSDQYDAAAEYPLVAEKKYNPAEPTTLIAYDGEARQGAKAVIPVGADIPAETTKILMIVDNTEKPEAIELNEGEETLNVDISFYSINSSGSKTKITDFGEGKTVSVDLSTVLPDGHELLRVYNTHDPAEPTAFTKVASKDLLAEGSFCYDSANKMMYLASSKYSPFTFVTKQAQNEVKITKDDVPASDPVWMSLAEFRDSVNDGNTYAGYTATLMKSVDLSDVDNWTSISTTGDYNKAFAGVFDGNGNVISKMKTTDGGLNGSLFGSVTGTIKNLTLKDATVVNGRGSIATLGARSINLINCHLINCSVNTNNSTGLLLGYVDEVDNALIKDCTIDSDSVLTSSAGNQAGGIVGQVCSGTNNKTITIDGCTNNADISGSNSVGGIVGQLGSGVEQATIKNCVNTGTITLTATSNAKYAGGIIGYRNCGGTTSGNTTIENCINSGTVTSALSGASIGGFFGYSNGVAITFTECNSTGNVGVNDATQVSGYIANLNGGEATFDDCSSAAVLTGETVNKGNYYGSKNGTVTINENCNPKTNN